jgi:uncharacterized damage-inducible protein DinB
VRSLLQRRFARANTLYLDLVEVMTPERLSAGLPGLPSDTVGHQLWCVLGARESYPRAARAGEWRGFTSPVTSEQLTDSAALISALEATNAHVTAWLGELDDGDEDSLTYALALLEHETQHHGQLIRYLYGLGIPRPESWQRQYALDEDF